MFGQDRQQLRRFFQASWQKRQAGEPLQPLEQLVAGVVAQHPEYHAQLADDDALQRDFAPADGQTNPWLHMAMHVSLAEQLGAPVTTSFGSKGVFPESHPLSSGTLQIVPAPCAATVSKARRTSWCRTLKRISRT